MSGRVGSITTDIVSDGLVFHVDAANRASYPKTGTTVFDTKNLSHSGSFNNDVAFNSSPSNFEFGLDGVDDYIEFNNTSTINEPLTISFWYYTDNGSQVGQLLSRGAADYEVYQHTNGNALWTYIGGKYPLGTKISVVTNSWTNVTFTIVGDVQYSYQNGILDKTNTLNGTPSFSNNHTFTIGRRTQTSAQYWDGSIASIQLYNRPLSATEVLHNYTALKSRFGL